MFHKNNLIILQSVPDFTVSAVSYLLSPEDHLMLHDNLGRGGGAWRWPRRVLMGFLTQNILKLPSVFQAYPGNISWRGATC